MEWDAGNYAIMEGMVKVTNDWSQEWIADDKERRVSG
jgi:hypothetical protein